MRKQEYIEHVAQLVFDHVSNKLDKAGQEELDIWAAKSPHNRERLNNFSNPKWVEEQLQTLRNIDMDAEWAKLMQRIRKN